MPTLEGLRLLLVGQSPASRDAAARLAARGVERTRLAWDEVGAQRTGQGKAPGPRLLAHVHRSDLLFESLGAGVLEAAGLPPSLLLAEQPALVLLRFAPEAGGAGGEAALDALAAYVERQRTGRGAILELSA